MYSFIKVLSLIIILIFVFIINAFYKENSHVKETVIIIKPGTSVAEITKLMCEKKLFFNAKLLELIILITGNFNKLKAGEYNLQNKSSAFNFLEKLIKGKVLIHQLTIVSGLTNYQVIHILNKQPNLRGELLEVPNCYLLPDTYNYTYGTARSTLLNKMREEGARSLALLWKNNKNTSRLSNINEVVILASIIEKEIRENEEMPRAAAVFFNRLAKNMPLQADFTTLDPTLSQSIIKRVVTKADLKNSHPYNTYLHKGLPPGPICNPSLEAIKSVLQPLVTNELYFVANGKGGHIFAHSLKEHNNNINKLR